mmetsp:Transcript_34015/g.64986  ORF Transcript_34015/g.64986 Transcript_34015/m.64986 type:complete len:162 (+) Transcript_34015:150-635(+)
MAIDNPTPVVHAVVRERRPVLLDEAGSDDEMERELFSAGELFEHVRDIMDPEHPYTLEQLKVITEEHITVDDLKGKLRVEFTPTVMHCSMATLIGLCLRVKLMRCIPRRFKLDIFVSPGSHSSEAATNKQLNDKERVAAALENQNLLEMVNKCLNGVQPEL